MHIQSNKFNVDQIYPELTTTVSEDNTMSNFFSPSGADDHPGGSGDDNFFSFKNDEESRDQTGGSLFGNSSTSGKTQFFRVYQLL